MQNQRSTTTSIRSAVTGLAGLVRGTEKLLLKETGLSEIRLWQAKCRGKIKLYFPDNTELDQYWASIELTWFQNHGPNLDDETLYQTLSQGEEEYYWEEMKDYGNYCRSTVRYLRDILLNIIVHAEAGELNATKAVINKAVSDLPNPNRRSPDIGFINDSDINALCRQHMTSALVSGDAGAYLPALHQIGFALEGILYGFACQHPELTKNTKATQKSCQENGIDKTVSIAVAKWTLDMHLAVATELGWITKEGGSKLGAIVRD